MRAFMLRHQHAGIITSHVFINKPTVAQLEPLVKECERLHGTGGWVLIHEAELVGHDVPKLTTPPRKAHNLTLGAPTVSGKGTVT